jgi:CTP synthase (UTP-ammonia lyase)
MFIVQEAIHADYVSSHETREEAVAAIEDLIQAGLAVPGDFNIREIDATGRIVAVFEVAPAAADRIAPG